MSPSANGPLCIRHGKDGIGGNACCVSRGVRGAVTRCGSTAFIGPNRLHHHCRRIGGLPMSRLTGGSPLLRSRLIPLPGCCAHLHKGTARRITQGLIGSLAGSNY